MPPSSALGRLSLWLDLTNLLFALLSSASTAFLLWLIANNEQIHKLIRRGNGGKYVRALLVGGLLSGLSSLPYLLLSISFQSQVCPFQWLHVLASVRVFSLRFEISQCLCLALDRLIVSFEPNSSSSRRLRRRLFWPFHALCGLFGLSDLLMFALKDRWSAYSFDCTILSVANPLYLHWHFFLMNFLTLALGLALLLGQFICHPIHIINSPLRRQMSKLANLLLTAFCLALGSVVAVQMTDRFTEFEEKRVRNFADMVFQLFHLIYFPAFLFYGVSTTKVQTSIVSTNTLMELGVSRHS